MSDAKQTASPRGLSRRAALARLGLATGVTYAAPSLLRIDRKAKAELLPSDCPPPDSPVPRPPHCPPLPPGPGLPPS